jgi:hypothetical protein
MVPISLRFQHRISVFRWSTATRISRKSTVSSTPPEEAIQPHFRTSKQTSMDPLEQQTSRLSWSVGSPYEEVKKFNNDDDGVPFLALSEEEWASTVWVR